MSKLKTKQTQSKLIELTATYKNDEPKFTTPIEIAGTQTPDIVIRIKPGIRPVDAVTVFETLAKDLFTSSVERLIGKGAWDGSEPDAAAWFLERRMRGPQSKRLKK